MERLNRTTAPAAKTYTEKVIQFGEGNFLRGFVDWIIWNTNKKTDLDASVVVVQPIDRGMVDMLNEQDGLYHVNLQGLDGGKPVDSIEMVDVISRASTLPASSRTSPHPAIPANSSSSCTTATSSSRATSPRASSSCPASLSSSTASICANAYSST